MVYPSILQYQEVLQHPATAFTDPLLKAGTVNSSKLTGMPIVISGGFALTYCVRSGDARYAVRCFHREASGLEKRYREISQVLQQLSSPYFVKADYQHAGIRVDKGVFPVVKMDWISGETLGEFVDNHFNDTQKLSNLISAISRLAQYLELAGIAHGDIQEGNMLVAEDGKRIQLIDYDGIYVPSLAAIGGTEQGHRDYQHPGRDGSQYDARLDRFSFIAIHFALRALTAKPALWRQSQSGAGVILFRANDFADPDHSAILADMAAIPAMADEAKRFAAVCLGRYDQIPTLVDFNVGRNIPAREGSAVKTFTRYIGQYEVLEASRYDLFLLRVGDTVELIGKVVEVKECSDRQPWVFINFGDWRRECVKIILWADALRKSESRPNRSWVGKWVSLVGLVEPVYPSKNPKYHYNHVSINARNPMHIMRLSEEEARWRLVIERTPAGRSATVSNAALFQKMQGAPSQAPSTVLQAPTKSMALPASPPPPPTSNQALLDQMKRTHAAQNPPPLPKSTKPAPAASASSSGRPVPRPPGPPATPADFAVLSRQVQQPVRATDHPRPKRAWLRWVIGFAMLALLLCTLPR